MTHVLEIDSVRKSFGNKPLLTDVYMRCETGNIIGLLGRNGCGKSTLFKIWFGVMTAQQKHIRLNEIPISKPYLKPGIICYLPQQRFLPGNLSIRKTVNLFLPGKNLDNDPILSLLYEQQINELSQGERRYLEIKLILMSDVKFVMLDEPFNGLSPALAETIKNMIVQEAHQGKGIVLSDHQYRNVLGISNKLYLLDGGAVREIKNDKKFLLQSYFGFEPDETSVRAFRK